jgi:aminoglycoside phosphotransferase (APT) family kinase protein
VEARWGGQWRAERVRSELVSYFPEHSATLRSRLRLVESGSGRTRVWSVYGKLRHDDSARRIFPAMAQLHASGVVAAGAVAYARPLDHCAGTQLLWQEGIAALTLDRALASGTVGSSLWPRVARAIATLHDTAIDLPVSVSAESVARDMQRAVDVISRALPMHTRDVARLHASLRRRAASIDWRPGALLHGDLHSRNVLVDARQVHLIDLDRLGRGPALAELGSLFGERVLRDCEANRPIDWQALARLSLDYGRARGQMPCPEQLGWHLAAALLCERAYRCVTSLKPGRIAALPRLLAAADTALDGALESALQRCAA